MPDLVPWRADHLRALRGQLLKARFVVLQEGGSRAGPVLKIGTARHLSGERLFEQHAHPPLMQHHVGGCDSLQRAPGMSRINGSNVTARSVRVLLV